MRRGSNNWIRFGDEEELTLTHGMSMQGGQVVCDWYDVEGEGRRIRYLPEELAELHEAIHEMLRMTEQHRDALTDGAEQQLSEPEPYQESVCGDPFVDPRLRTVLANEVESEPVPDEAQIEQAMMGVLRELADGKRLYFDSAVPEWSWNDGRAVDLYGASGLALSGLIEDIVAQTADYPSSRTFFTITDAGRCALAAQTPEAESEP